MGILFNYTIFIWLKMVNTSTMSVLNPESYSTEFPIELGRLNTQCEKCLQLADRHHIPAIFFWTPGSGCHYCNEFER